MAEETPVPIAMPSSRLKIAFDSSQTPGAGWKLCQISHLQLCGVGCLHGSTIATVKPLHPVGTVTLGSCSPSQWARRGERHSGLGPARGDRLHAPRHTAVGWSGLRVCR